MDNKAQTTKTNMSNGSCLMLIGVLDYYNRLRSTQSEQRANDLVSEHVEVVKVEPKSVIDDESPSVNLPKVKLEQLGFEF